MMKERLIRLMLCTMLLALSSLGLAAQEVVVPGAPEPPTPSKLNEVRWNLYAPIPYMAFSLEYERAVALDVSVGVMASTYFGTERANVVLFPTAGVMPYGRWYFGGRLFSVAKPNAGFFLEANSSIAYNDNLRNVYYEYSPETGKKERKIEERRGISWGIGFGGGFKLITRSNLSGEVSLRLGRNIVKVSKWNIAYIYPAISVGYRF